MSVRPDVQDYNAQARLSIAREMAAEALYDARAVAYELAVPPWKTLTHETRERYREVAQAHLEALKPKPRGLPPIVLTGLGAVPGSRIIGAIQPTKGGL